MLHRNSAALRQLDTETRSLRAIFPDIQTPGSVFDVREESGTIDASGSFSNANESSDPAEFRNDVQNSHIALAIATAKAIAPWQDVKDLLAAVHGVMNSSVQDLQASMKSFDAPMDSFDGVCEPDHHAPLVIDTAEQQTNDDTGVNPSRAARQAARRQKSADQIEKLQVMGLTQAAKDFTQVLQHLLQELDPMMGDEYTTGITISYQKAAEVLSALRQAADGSMARKITSLSQNISDQTSEDQPVPMGFATKSKLDRERTELETAVKSLRQGLEETGPTVMRLTEKAQEASSQDASREEKVGSLKDDYKYFKHEIKHVERCISALVAKLDPVVVGPL